MEKSSAAVALHNACYNFCKIHQTIRCTPAMEAGVVSSQMFGQLVAWEGVVETFDLKGHAKAKRCYAWSYPDGKETCFIAVPEIPPIISPSQPPFRSLSPAKRKENPNENQYIHLLHFDFVPVRFNA